MWLSIFNQIIGKAKKSTLFSIRIFILFNWKELYLALYILILLAQFV